jgi:hypothetical protein
MDDQAQRIGLTGTRREVWVEWRADSPVSRLIMGDEGLATGAAAEFSVAQPAQYAVSFPAARPVIQLSASRHMMGQRGARRTPPEQPLVEPEAIIDVVSRHREPFPGDLPTASGETRPRVLAGD